MTPRFRPEPLTGYARLSDEDMVARARAFRDEMRTRRTVRTFASDPVPEDVVRACIEAAGTAPSGANRQPWHFVAIREPDVKRRIREAAESEEREFYEHRAPAEWLAALEELGTDAEKPFLEDAPVLIAVFVESYRERDGGVREKNYYATESVGIATGILIAALHRAGLATLTHTPSPMRFLNRVLERPENERPFLLLVAGHPAEGTVVPTIRRKTLDEIASVLPPLDQA